MIYLLLGGGVFSILLAFILYNSVKSDSAGTSEMQRISDIIKSCAFSFLRTEMYFLGIFLLLIGVIILGVFGMDHGFFIACCYLAGGLCSALTSYAGMAGALIGNVRTAQAARNSVGRAFRVALRSGALMGFAVVGFGLLGINLLIFLLADVTYLPQLLIAFALGASTVALFARVGGGIFTKGADIAADFAGKLELGLPEDDPRNPAVIADNVGDNVGDVAGMGADLFESLVGSVVAAQIVGMLLFPGEMTYVFYPLLIVLAGLVSSCAGLWSVFMFNKKEPLSALNLGQLTATIVSLILVSIVSFVVLSESLGAQIQFMVVSVISGLVAGILLGLSTEYATSSKYKSVREISNSAKYGAASVVLNGISHGFLSITFPVLILCFAIIISYFAFGVYGIALAAVGMLSTLAFNMSVNAFGPVADNAGGIARIAGLGETVRKRTDVLDAVGNTTSAMGKGYAVGSAALAALALFMSYAQAAQLSSVNILNMPVVLGMLIGSFMPFLFAGLTIRSVYQIAESIVNIIRKTVKIKTKISLLPSLYYLDCVNIAAKESMRKMLLPGILAFMVPIGVGLFFGAEAAAGLISTSLLTGVLLAMSMANSGGAWDNAKKYIEAGSKQKNNKAVYAAAVVGDTVGDPLKDTAGPSLNILIKVMTIVCLLAAPFFVKYGGILF